MIVKKVFCQRANKVKRTKKDAQAAVNFAHSMKGMILSFYPCGNHWHITKGSFKK